MSLTVYGYPNTRSLRVTWTLEELQLDYEYRLVDLAKGELQSPEFLAINPAGKIPALQCEDGILTESGAIAEYLVERHPGAALMPAEGAFRRGVCRQWCLFALTELEQPVWTIGKHKFALPRDQRCAEIFPSAGWEFQRALKRLSEGLGDQDYLLGDSFSLADIFIGHTLFWGMAFKQPIEAPNVRAYVERLGQRPALKAARSREQAAMEAVSG